MRYQGSKFQVPFLLAAEQFVNIGVKNSIERWFYILWKEKNAWLSYGESDEKEMEKLAKDYRAFLDAGKTERECVTELVREAEANGYVSLEAKQAAGEKIQPGDKVYAVGMKKIMHCST